MRSPAAWITKLKVAELHRLAVKLGAPCSGTKLALIQGIQNAISPVPHARNEDRLQRLGEASELSLLSIDMGIRNLGFSHWTAELTSTTSKGLPHYEKPTLRAWRRINISATPTKIHAGDVGYSSKIEINKGLNSNVAAQKESFEPIDYAQKAYDFIKMALAEYKPSNVLIERQRFRSGGMSAVQEWTIRVGVFEGMLYAVLKSLASENREYRNLVVEPILPTRVNRYWLEDDSEDGHVSAKPIPAKKSAREVKKMKIELVKKLLRAISEEPERSLFKLDENMHGRALAFIENGARSGKNGPKPRTKVQNDGDLVLEISKLDDLADSFLQGLAWIQWQNNRSKLANLDQDEITIPPHIVF